MFSDFDARIVRQDSCGVKFNTLIADSMGELWYDTPRHPQISLEQAHSLKFEVDRKAEIGWKEMAILRDHILRAGDRVLECGCHHGVTTVLLAGWVGPRGFVTAFDAVLLNAMIAKRNLELNHIANARVYCAAIGGSRQIVSYRDESNVVIEKGAERPGSESTVMITLEDAMQRGADVLKLDVEGCELDILETSRELVQRIPRLAIEVHTDMLPKDGIDRLLQCLKDRQLHVLWENGAFEKYSGQKIGERVHLFAF